MRAFGSEWQQQRRPHCCRPDPPGRLVRLLLLLLLLLRLEAAVDAHPSLITCVCGTTLASGAVVKTSSAAAKGQAAVYVVPSCVGDVFAETGVRWYIDGPVEPDVTYWRREPVEYASGRAAARLLSLGYRCSRTQLYDPRDADT